MESERAPDVDLSTLQGAGEDRAARQARLGELFEKHRGRLLKMIHLRMDPALKARLGASDVLQEAYLEIADRIDDYLDDPRMTFFLWIRFITAQRLLKLYRFHAGAKKRDMRRELHVAPSVGPDATSIALVDHLVASGVTPSMVMAQGEMQGALLDALEGMEAIDREVLALRHFEELDNAEVARVLEIPPNTASKRYMRALERLAKVVKGGALGTS
ncbi:MAG: sigma-70 family RNA polymerase sigma factor [Planctomycetota bacterium]|nr:sigma-70 family RNA polymerase sigma factor [Planctomycetota bacterium]MCB9824512.1 sigma-70 family RNA polymerase sigma factor [Planctomycetota bacterium]MCB9900509.1 sigma-70 family RNA polymerase sigma factor [Planctomycetota bacterium]